MEVFKWIWGREDQAEAARGWLDEVTARGETPGGPPEGSGDSKEDRRRSKSHG